MLTVIDFKKCLNKQNYVWGCCLVEIVDSHDPSGYHIYKAFKLPKSKIIRCNFCVYAWQYVYTATGSTYQLPYKKEIRFDDDTFSNEWVFKTKEECEKYTKKLNNKELSKHKYIKTFEPVNLIKPAYEERPVNYHKIQFNYGDIVKFIRYINDKDRYEYKIGFIVELCWYNGCIGIFDGNSYTTINPDDFERYKVTLLKKKDEEIRRWLFDNCTAACYRVPFSHPELLKILNNRIEIYNNQQQENVKMKWVIENTTYGVIDNDFNNDFIKEQLKEIDDV